ncbi:MAG: sigma-70 family RNA polymerase sigma factor [Chitinophagales bacterium]
MTNKVQYFEQTFMPLADDLYNYAYHLTLQQANAEDLVQETLIKVFKSIDQFDKGTNAKAWMFTILKNSFINQYRKQKASPSIVDYEDYIIKESNDTVWLDTDLEDYHQFLGDEMTVALDELKEEFREVILLCDMEDFSYEEIAAIADIPIGTVRSRLHRARKELQIKLKNYANSLGFKTEKL